MGVGESVKDGQAATDVGAPVVNWIGSGVPHLGQPGQVAHAINVGERRGQGAGRVEVALESLDTGGQRGRRGAGQPDHVVAVLDEEGGHRVADESGGSGDQDSHGPRS